MLLSARFCLLQCKLYASAEQPAVLLYTSVVSHLALLVPWLLSLAREPSAILPDHQRHTVRLCICTHHRMILPMLPLPASRRLLLTGLPAALLPYTRWQLVLQI